MKKNTILILLIITLFACSSSEENNLSNSSIEQTSNGVRIEVKKDYEYFIKRISEDDNWMIQIEMKAEEMGISTEESLSRNANFMAEKNGYNKVVQTEIEKQIEKIKDNEKWFSKVEEQALERSISVDSMLVRSAKFTLSSKKN